MANLTPEQLQRLQQSLNQGGYTDPSGMSYGLLNSSGVGAEGHGDPSQFGNGMYIGGNYKPGGQYNIYDGQGADTGRTGTYGQDWSELKQMAIYAAILASAGYAGSALAGAGATGGGAAGAAAAGATETMPYMSLLEAPASAGLEPYVIGAGATGAGAAGTMPYMSMLEAPATAGLEPYAIGGAGATGGGATAATPSSSGAPAYTTAAADSQLASSTLGLPTIGGAEAPAIAANGGWSSFLSGLTGSGLLGPAASVVGGLLGSQGTQREQTTQNQIDPRMVPYIYGDQGLLPQVQQQMQRSISPERQQLLQTQRDAGAGLLRQPVAGNGFSRMFPGR